MRQSGKYLGLTALALICAAPAAAYTGPGLGMATITVVLGFLASIFIAIFALIWYPVKRMLKRKKVAASSETDTPRVASDSDDEAQ